MILNALNDLYPRLVNDPDYEIAKLGYSPQNISFQITLESDGSFFSIRNARLPDAKGKLRAQRRLVLGEAKPSGSGINPGFLWDNMAYMLGYKKDDPKPDRTEKSFFAFREVHLAVEKEINHPHFSAVCRFLENWSSERAAEYAEENPEIEELITGFGLFKIQGQAKFVNEEPSILAWWDNRSVEDSGATLGQCLITGEESVAIARLHPKIKSVAGAQSAGASLVSFNAPAYESYGKDQSFNAPVSEKAAFQYGTALNALLNGRNSTKHRIRIGDSTCVFWTDKPSLVEDTFGIFATEGSNAPEKAQDPTLRARIESFLKLLQQAGEPRDVNVASDQTNFYLLGLAPNAARLSVRFFHRSSVEELLNNLRAHHADLEIVREWEETKGKRLADPKFPPFWQLLSQTARVSDEIPPLLGGSLMRAILEHTLYPESLYTSVIRRIRADRTINYLRASIIKGVLTRNHQLTHPITIMLDLENKDSAYLLGRLFAALEKTQQDALGDLNAGLRDKFYSSASATPASVFPRILRTYQHHLAKLSGGAKVVREKLIQDILDFIPASGFPANLSLKSQGIFAIGYYHQRKAFFTKKETLQDSQTHN